MELRRHYEKASLEKTPETFKRDMADYLRQQIQERRQKRIEAIKGLETWARKLVNPITNGARR